MNIKKTILSLALSLFVLALFSQEYTVSGYVKDFKTQDPIIGAAVFEANTVTNGTPTDTEGYFSLDFTKKNVYIKFAYIGYKDTTLNLYLTKDTVISVYIKSDTEIEEVKIEDDEIHWKPDDNSLKTKERIIFAQLSEPKIEMKYRYFPFKKIINYIPPTDLNEIFYQKAQGTNQAAIYIDGARLFSSENVFDFMPVLNKFEINSIKYFPNSFPAKYGNFVSPVLDIKLKEGNFNNFKAVANISFSNVSISAQGPVISNKSSFFASAGVSYFNNFYTDLFRKNSANKLWSKPTFYNLILKYTHQISENDKIFTSFFTRRNKKNYEYNESLETTIEHNYNNKITQKQSDILMSAHWNHVFSPDYKSNFSIVYSQYNLNNNFSSDSIGLLSGNRSTITSYETEYKNRNNSFGLNLNFNYKIDEHNIEIGAKAFNHHFNPVKGKLVLNDFVHNFYNDTSWQAKKYNAQEYTVYAQDKFIINEDLMLEAGIHFSSFISKGKTFFSVEPRIYGTYKLFKFMKLNASYSTHKQYIHFLSSREIGLSTDIFAASNKDILPQFTHHIVAGASLKLPFDINLKGNVFYDISNNVLEYKDKYSFYNFEDKLVYPGKNIVERLEQGKENLYGLNVILQKNFENFSFKAVHYISHSQREFKELGDKNKFTYRHNRVHDFRLEISYKITDDLTAGINWMYKSGNFVTLAKQSYVPYDFRNGTMSSKQFEQEVKTLDETYVTPSENINKYQLPAFHRADFFISYVIDNHKIGLHIYNLYNRKNPDYVDFQRGVNTEKTINEITSYTTLPFFPMLTYSFEF